MPGHTVMALIWASAALAVAVLLGAVWVAGDGHWFIWLGGWSAVAVFALFALASAFRARSHAAQASIGQRIAARWIVGAGAVFLVTVLLPYAPVWDRTCPEETWQQGMEQTTMLHESEEFRNPPPRELSALGACGRHTLAHAGGGSLWSLAVVGLALATAWSILPALRRRDTTGDETD